LVSYGEMSNFNNIKCLTKTKITPLNAAPVENDSPIQGFY